MNRPAAVSAIGVTVLLVLAVMAARAWPREAVGFGIGLLVWWPVGYVMGKM